VGAETIFLICCFPPLTNIFDGGRAAAEVEEREGEGEGEEEEEEEEEREGGKKKQERERKGDYKRNRQYRFSE